MFNPETNYTILSSKSEFLKLLITKHIQQINIDAGLYPNQSLFGKCILVGDDIVPTPKKYVISYIKRDGFKLIDLDEEPLAVLSALLNIENKEAKAYIRNKLLKNPNIKPNALYYYMVLLRDCIDKQTDSFNYTKADIIVGTYTFETTSSQLDRYKALNSYVTNPSEKTLFDLVRVFQQGQDVKQRLTNIAYCVKAILDDTVPDYIKSRINFSQDQAIIMNYLNLSLQIATFETFEEFISNMINKLVD